MTDSTTMPSRRQVLLTSGAVAAAAAVTAACGSSGDTASTGVPTISAGTSLKTSDVPVGGGTVLQDAQVVVTQPTAGQYKAFTAVCTHEGCLVAGIQDGTIVCPCHNGQYSITDGSVVAGPPPAPLAEVKVTVSGDTLTLG